MDTAVALVQAYLHVNGYFTVTEYPVLEAFHRDHTRAVTDLDVLAFRFAHAAHDLKRGRGRRPLEATLMTPDPALACPADCPDMIVGEVKEGPARFNPAARDPVVLIWKDPSSTPSSERAGGRPPARRVSPRHRIGRAATTMNHSDIRGLGTA